jgi:two-component system, OmpR family, sensor kinase
MIRSLRGRLFVGVTAIIILTGTIGGGFAYRWAFEEAIEMQDSTLIQIASLAQDDGFKGRQALHGVDDDADVWIMELGTASSGARDDARLLGFADGLHGGGTQRSGDPGALENPRGRQPVCGGAKRRHSRRDRQ